MTTINVRKVFVSITVIILVFFVAWYFSIMYFNNSPGLYRYTVDIRGLEDFTSGSVTDILVPLPQRNGQPVFSDDELQYKRFGNWTSLIVVTKDGKMLSFRTTGRNLTPIHAEFSKKYRDGTVIRNITQESLTPVLPLVHSEYSMLKAVPDPARDYSSIVYIPDTIRPLHSAGGTISVSLDLIAIEGMQHSVNGKVYTVQVSERFPPAVYNAIPVLVHISEGV
ncbi:MULTISPECIES: hypothetical protein [unclassified Methanoregula]|uniref:hypothetical protein n=1 Tax=unclassified Methanoregula TaxID=2649730 RepID=UPI0009D5DD78|nr:MULTISPECIES: hypothetical protein [unclassified Methanoregula]OPX65333.1 MAG: hypothetical protein A4E33_00366 [Methanoregula sp. PtaB.Bin085]OPY32242.1 MAG: hypothetical protein A4E34_02616 [Methanoregula sp. PtaU1.Bin006]